MQAVVEVSLDDFDDEDILEAADDIRGDRRGRYEELYYETRGEGPIPKPTASKVRDLLAELAGRAA